MFQRILGRSLFAMSLGACFYFGACTKSHDVEPSEQPLGTAGRAAGSGSAGRSDSGASAGRSGASASAGRGGSIASAGRSGSTGSAGRAGSTGAAGRAGATGSAGRAGSGQAGAAGGTVLSCGTCASANVFNILAVPACCTSDAKCGLDLSTLGIMMCVEQNAPGTLDASCPAGMTMGISMQGCCREDGTCGTMDTLLGLGCTVSTSGQTMACKSM
jgi:pilus assembly protein FimV